MTQILIDSTDILRTSGNRHAVDQLLDALLAAESIPTTDGVVLIAGGTSARYGALIRIDAERFPADTRGPAQEKRWLTFATPADANAVVLRMLHEGREIYGITAVQGALGGTTTR